MVEHAFVVPGVHHATLTVTDPAGAIAQTVVAVTVPVLNGGPGVKGPPPQVIPDTNAPTISKLSLSKRITRAANRPKLVVRKRAQLRLTLSEAAMLKLTFAKANGRGFKPVPGSVTLKARAGAIGILLRGQLSARRRLAAGTYRITVVATDAAGNRSAPARATFTLIVPAAHPRRGAGAPVVFARL